MVSKVLSPAVRLFLRANLEGAEALDLQIRGHDRQILRGYIPDIRLEVTSAIYRGLHLGPVKLRGENIRLDIGKVLRGKPLQLLEPLRVSAEATVNETALNESLDSPLLVDAFTDLSILFLERNGVSEARERFQKARPRWTAASLRDGYFRLTGTVGEGTPLALAAGLKLPDPRTLAIFPHYLEGFPEWSALRLRPFTVALEDVEIEALVLSERFVHCRGRLSIRP
jgi:hypothetical protein